MSIPTPNKSLTKLADGHRTIAFRGICYVLSTDPVLSGELDDSGTKLLWLARTGEDDLIRPSPEMCPYIALSLMPRADQRSTNETATIPLEVLVELGVRGSCQDDIVNLWDAVVAAMLRRRTLPNGKEVGDFLRCGLPVTEDDGTRPAVPDFRLTDPAFRPYVPSDAQARPQPAGMLRGVGKIEFSYERRR